MHKYFGIVTLLLALTGCTGLPKGVKPVDGLDRSRYLGTWYEIARLPHSFEEGLSRVTAEYRLNDDGSIAVINRGYRASEGKWEEANGRAVFVDEPDYGHLKVSFFGPFYSSYVIFDLDEDYQWVYVSGFNHNYLWLLSRTPTVSDTAIARFKDAAAARGFDIDKLIMVDQQAADVAGQGE